MDSNEITPRTYSGNFRKVKRRKGSAIFCFIHKNDFVPLLFLTVLHLLVLPTSGINRKTDDFSYGDLYLNLHNDLQNSIDQKIESKVQGQNFVEEKSKYDDDSTLNNDVSMFLKDDDDKQRIRRLSAEASVMSFYRPTKKVFVSSNDHPMALEGKQKRHENDDKLSTVELSKDEFSAEELTSSEGSPPHQEIEIPNGGEHSIGGINHIPGNFFLKVHFMAHVTRDIFAHIFAIKR